jgi:hypothetical protein
MKRNFILMMLLLLPSVVFGQIKESDMMRGAKPVTTPEATIVVGVNDTVGGEAQPGWPIIISAAVVSEKDPSPDVPANLVIQVTDEKNKPVSLSFEPVMKNDKSQAFWILSEAASKSLTPGTYRISLAPVSGFAIQPADLVIEPVNQEAAGSFGLLKIQELLLLGKDTEALAEADRLILLDTNNADALIAKGDILMSQDLPDEALKLYDQALEIKMKSGDEPLFLEERRSTAFSRSLEKRGVISTINQP